MIAASSRVGFSSEVSDGVVTEASPSIASDQTGTARSLLRRPMEREARPLSGSDARQGLGQHFRDWFAFLCFVLGVVLHRGQDSCDCFAEHQVAILSRPLVGKFDLMPYC